MHADRNTSTRTHDAKMHTLVENSACVSVFYIIKIECIFFELVARVCVCVCACVENSSIHKLLLREERGERDLVSEMTMTTTAAAAAMAANAAAVSV